MNLLEKIQKIPKFFIANIFCFILLALLVMYDASEGAGRQYFIKQLIYFIMFIPGMFLVSVINIKIIYNLTTYFYVIALGLLVCVMLFGHTAMGATRWLNFGVIKFQPSELIKISVVLMLAKYFHNTTYEEIGKFRYLVVPLMIVLIPMLIIIKQPDLGTAMTLLIISCAIFFLAGVRMWKFALCFVAVVIAAPIIWNNLHDYQRNRVLTFLSPEADPLGKGYHIIQSKIAIGSGGLFGKGRLEGSQAQLNFLPEYQTDFVFSLYAEEFGFIGCLVLIGLFCSLIANCIYIALHCKYQYGRLMAFGILSIITCHFLINVGMVTGLLPVVGIPFPLLSYGGSSIATNMVSLGLIMNVCINGNATLSGRLGYV